MNNRGIYKRSFSLNYDGGEIWAEHLDAIENLSDARAKFDLDMKTVSRPSSPSFIAVNLDETAADEEFIKYILSCFANCPKRIVKVVFVGLSPENKKLLIRVKKRLPFAAAAMADFEEAKHWLLFGRC